jgi:hypothetical protein
MTRKPETRSVEEFIAEGWQPVGKKTSGGGYTYLLLMKDGQRKFIPWKPEYEKYLLKKVKKVESVSYANNNNNNNNNIDSVSNNENEKNPKEEFVRKAELAALATDYRVWWERITQQRPLIEDIVKRVSWLQTALFDIGFAAFLTLCQYAKIPPEQWNEKLMQYQNREAFVKDMLMFMAALLEASKKASIVAELEKKVKALDFECELCYDAFERLKEKYRNDTEKLLKRMSLLVASMCDQDRERFMQAEILMQLGELGITPKKEEAKKEINTGKTIEKV